MTGLVIAYNRRPLSVLILALTVLAMIRLVGFVISFGEQSLQMDFAAFYTAGEAANAGLSPYKNHLFSSPPLWDGVSKYQHSRFLYPPVVAALFRPAASLPYHVAKYLWMIANLVAVLVSLYLAASISEGHVRAKHALLLVFALLVFHPLLTLLERGQVDGLTLCLVTIGIFLMCKDKNQVVAGLLLAVATILKLHTILVLPFLVLRRRWNAVGGYVLGMCILSVLCLLVCGAASTLDFVTIEFPRISTLGELGTRDMLVDGAATSSLPHTAEITVKNGRSYQAESFAFVYNASLVRTPLGRWLQRHLATLGLPSSLSTVCVLLYSCFFIVLSLLHWRDGRARSLEPREEFLYWQLVLVGILLCAPLSWVMNTVWLIALLPFVVNSLSTPQSISRESAAGIALVSLGVLAAAVPDHLSFGLLFPFPTYCEVLGNGKYVLAELAIALGLVLYLWRFNLCPIAGRPGKLKFGANEGAD